MCASSCVSGETQPRKRHDTEVTVVGMWTMKCENVSDFQNAHAGNECQDWYKKFVFI